MLKLLDTSAFYQNDEPNVTLLDLAQVDKGLEKKAAHEDIQAFVEHLEIKPGYTYLLINAMTAGEFHGSNRNGDWFPEDNLKKYFKTFETTPAYVYRSHINKDPKRSYGKVIFAIYNDRMHRVELICECPDDLVDDINSRIKAGDFPTTSMACKTPYDTCSICGNRAHSRQEYCIHLRTQLNRLLPDGRKVMAINNGPLTFFDISIVIRPADVNSSILQKIAYADIVSSAELAEIEGLTEDGFQKRAQLKKLSELIKEITDGCYVSGAGKTPAEILGSAAPNDLPLHLVEKLHHFPLSHVLSSMADLGISPSIKFLAELIVRQKFGEGYNGIGTIVENFIQQVPVEEEVPIMNFEEPSERSLIVASILKPFVESSSLLPKNIEKRASNIGYAGNGPHIEPRPEELKANQNLASELVSQEMNSINYAKLLLGIGGAALLAKYFITSQIEKRLRESGVNNEKHVKITIVKQASDYLVTSKLAKMAMIQSLPKQKKESDSKTAADISLSATKYALRESGTRIGGKLAGLLKVFSLGSKLSDLNKVQ